MKFILNMLLMSLSALAAVAVSSGSVVINEVELNPAGDENEWVELFNSGEESIDIGRWSVTIEETLPSSGKWTGVITIPRNTSIEAGGYHLLEGEERWIRGNNGTVFLRTESWELVDRTPPRSDEGDDDFSWSRYPNGVDTDTTSDWAFIRSTPGRENVLGVGI
ncbi:MAG TPA: lamin tail domain-containing protein [Methanothrix sp.]|nr:lamin tail domain-containing protein [Methanothrix sp.]